jgi:lipopolysaccharide export system protein LptA
LQKAQIRVSYHQNPQRIFGQPLARCLGGVFILLSFALSQQTQAQAISLQAGRMKSLKKGDKTVQWLHENVRFEQSGSMVFCDEAEYDPQTEDLVGRGNVRITNPDGATVTGKILEYNNATHIAKVSGGVTLTDGSMTLTTPWIQYHTQTKVGWYGARGNIKDKETQLTSVSGSYNPALKTLFFKNKVVLTTPEYTVKTDTLQYRTDLKKAQFFAITQLDYKARTVVFNRGYYLTETQKGEFYGQVALFDSGRTVLCDTLLFNKKDQSGVAHGHVYIHDTLDQWQVWGDHAHYRGNAKSFSVWDKALAYQGRDKDLFRIKADTLHYNSDTAQPIALQAIHHVAFTQQTASGTCNKLTSFRKDSTFYFSGNPVLWDSLTRLSGDSMEMQVKRQKIKSLKAFPNAFVAIKEDNLHYSQIQGDSMLQRFTDQQKLAQVQVFRKAKSIYYLRDADTLQSANLVSSQNMNIRFLDGKINNIAFYQDPKGVLYPIADLPADEAKLERFLYDVQNKPTVETFNPPHTVVAPAFPYPSEAQRKALQRSAGSNKGNSKSDKGNADKSNNPKPKKSNGKNSKP